MTLAKVAKVAKVAEGVASRAATHADSATGFVKVGEAWAE